MTLDPHRSADIATAQASTSASDSNKFDVAVIERLLSMLAVLITKVDAIHQKIAAVCKPLYTVAEVASLTGRSPYTVRRWISEQQITAIRIGGTGPRGKLLVPHSELEKLIPAGQGTSIPAIAFQPESKST